MSKFLRTMTALSKKPSDFQKTVSASPADSVPHVVPPPKRQQVIGNSKSSTVDGGSASTMDARSTSTVDVEPTFVILWQAENGALFPSSRVRHVDRAQDALTHIEESVYNFLWGAKTAEPYKLAEAGYAEISRSARIAKRNAPVVIDRLIEKGYISIERQADIWTRRPTQYRVLGYRAILDELDRRGRRWVVRSGNGVLFAKRLEMRPTVDASSTSTVDVGQPSTADAGHQSTVDAGSTSTVDAASTDRDHKKETVERDTSSSSKLVDVCSKMGVILDDAAARQIVRRCQSADHTATVEEIGHFAELKVHQLMKRKNIENWPGMLMAAVPAYFDPPATELTRYREDQRREQEKQEQFAREILADPESTDADREWARSVIAPSTWSQK
jgi:predicted transcriptional regulator